MKRPKNLIRLQNARESMFQTRQRTGKDVEEENTFFDVIAHNVNTAVMVAANGKPTGTVI